MSECQNVTRSEPRAIFPPTPPEYLYPNSPIKPRVRLITKQTAFIETTSDQDQLLLSKTLPSKVCFQ